MKIKTLIALFFFYCIVSCNSTDNKNADNKSSSDTLTVSNKNLLTASINGTKTEDKSPLIIFKKRDNNPNESISISGVFNEANSHIGLVIVKDTGILTVGKYLLQKNEKLTNGRYETNINGGTTAIENTLYKASGVINITSLDTVAKKIQANFEMDAINKALEKVHITGHVNSIYK